MAADAIYFAAHHRREVWAGYSAIKAILGQRIAPGFADHYIARHGFSSQQTSEMRDPNQIDNLWSPVDGRNCGDHGAVTQNRSSRLDSQGSIISQTSQAFVETVESFTPHFWNS